MTGNVAIRSLGEIAKIGAGNSAPQGDHLFDGGQHPFFRTSDVGRIRFGEISTSADCLNEVGIRGLRLFPRGTILFPKSGASTFLNHRVMLDADGYVSSHLATIIADEAKVLPRFLLYFLSTVAAQDLVQDHAYPSLNLPVIAGIPVPLPKLQEQKRIVGILEEAFAGIATAKANAESNLQCTRDALHAAKRISFAALISRYESEHLGAVCEFENGDRGKNYPGKQHRVAQGVPFINAGHLTEDGVDFAEMDYISPERFRLLGNGKVRPNDVLFCLRGSLGKFASVGELEQAAIASSLVILRSSQRLDTDFLLEFLSSRQCAAQIESFKGGAAQPNLGAKDLKRFELPLPPLSTQRETAMSLIELREEVRALESIYQRKLAALDELKQSLLHQAFSGQL